MHLSHYHVRNFRRLKDAHVDLEKDISIFVGANNSGKTAAANALQMFTSGAKFVINDFNTDSWTKFDEIGAATALNDDSVIPRLTLDLWFTVDASDFHRVIDLIGAGRQQYIDIRQLEIQRLRPGTTRSVATVGKELGLLRAALRYMAKQRGLDGLKLYRYDTDEIFPEGVIGNYRPRDRALSIAEYHALYVALPADRREYLQAFCGLGTRDSELYRITPAEHLEPNGSTRLRSDRQRRQA